MTNTSEKIKQAILRWLCHVKRKTELICSNENNDGIWKWVDSDRNRKIKTEVE